jgi:N-formylglutamate amidohydrolase
MNRVEAQAVAFVGVTGFEVVPGSPRSRVVLHVPHSSRVIPDDVRAGIALDDEALDRELDAMTDARTDLIAQAAAQRSARRPWQFVNRLSRLVVDPERFPDDTEPMAAVGMGRVYTRTADGSVLRRPDPALETRFFEPYTSALAQLVEERRHAVERVCIIDAHSYPKVRLPYETGGTLRPPVSLGTDPYHTPQWMLEAARSAFAGIGEIAENTPFAGCYIPLAHYGCDDRVTGIMVELRRDVYESDLGGVATALASLVDAVENLP